MSWTTRGRHLVDYCLLILCCYWSLVELFVFSDHTSVCAFFGQCVYVTFSHQGVEMDELWPALNAPTVCRTGCSCSSSPPAKLLCSPASLCVGVADSGSCVCSGGKNGICKSVEMRGLNCSPDAEKGMIHWQPSLAHLTGTEAEVARRQEKHSNLKKEKNILRQLHTHVQSPRSWSNQWGGCLLPSYRRLSAPEHFLSPPRAPPTARGSQKR